jgi:hypothetical protein
LATFCDRPSAAAVIKVSPPMINFFGAIASSNAGCTGSGIALLIKLGGYHQGKTIG